MSFLKTLIAETLLKMLDAVGKVAIIVDADKHFILVEPKQALVLFDNKGIQSHMPEIKQGDSIAAQNRINGYLTLMLFRPENEDLYVTLLERLGDEDPARI